MADLGDERGQLVLVTAIALALALVVVVLLANTAIYTESLASQSPDVGDEEALSYRSAVVDAVGGVVDRENEDESDSYSDLQTNVTDTITSLNDGLLRTYARNGLVAGVNESTVSNDEGRLVRQTDDTREFNSSAPERKNWTIVTDTNGTRKFAATVDPTVSTTASDIETSPGVKGVFYVNVSDTKEWHVYVYDDNSVAGDDVTVAVKEGGSSTVTEVCSTGTAEATVNFTAGTLAGQDCSGYQWGEGVNDRYDLAFENGDNVTGTYDLTVRIEGSGSLNPNPTPSINDGRGVTDPASPYYVPAVYSTRLSLSYESPELLYRTTVRVAPGEPDG
jgi:hypothetical protein